MASLCAKSKLKSSFFFFAIFAIFAFSLFFPLEKGRNAAVFGPSDFSAAVRSYRSSADGQEREGISQGENMPMQPRINSENRTRSRASTNMTTQTCQVSTVRKNNNFDKERTARRCSSSKKKSKRALSRAHAKISKISTQTDETEKVCIEDDSATI